MSFKEDEDGYIHLTAHPDKLALECQNKDQGSAKYCTSSSDSDSSSTEEVGGSPQQRSQCIGGVETVEKGPHRYCFANFFFLCIYLTKAVFYGLYSFVRSKFFKDFAKHVWNTKNRSIQNSIPHSLSNL